MMNTFFNYINMDLGLACSNLFQETFTMILQIIVAFAVLAGFDFLYQWWDYEHKLKMTKHEVKEEYKQVEGDPKIKAKIKETQRKMAQSRMMQSVPQADVVIRNPQHVAIALRYKPEIDTAPIVLAKGLDELALRIVKVAEENHVATIENIPLARSLYSSTELNQEIPAELYGAVADVLVYLYQIGSKVQT
jgi:flagellar biosynthetic protein FlhB